MKKFETGKEKIQKICDILRRETLEPAEENAAKVIADAKAEATRIVDEARAEAERLEAAAHERIRKERSVFQSSMEQGARQSLELLRQEIENRLFDEQLGKTVAEATADPKLIATLANAIVEALGKQGMAADLSVVIPQAVKKEDVASLLLEGVRDQLKVGLFKGGVQVRLEDQNITVDISDEALVELLGRYVRKDYRELLYGKEA